MKINLSFVIGIAYITFILGASINSIGQQYEGGTYEWHLPLKILAVLGACFVAGFSAGRGNK